MNIFEKYPNSSFLKSLPVDTCSFPLRERITDLFRCLDGLEDPHFEQELDQDRDARLWEMMLAKILKSEGYQPTSANQGPDFVVEQDGKKIFIEAICPGPGDKDNPNSVPPLEVGASTMQDVPVEKIVLRYRSALDDKKLKYVRYLNRGIVSESDICIIAVSSMKIRQCLGSWPPVIMRATHGLGNQYVVFARGEGVVEEGIKSCTSLPKVNGPEIDTTFFLSGENNLISAVLYSDCSFFSYDFDLFKDSIFIHNPKACVPLPPGFLKRIKEIRDGFRGHPN